MTGSRMQGELLWFNEEKDRGALRTADGERIEFAGDAFAGGARPVGRCAGTPVELSIVGGPVSRTATEILVLSSDEPRRARRRGRTFS